MRQKYSDEEIVEVIRLLLEGKGDDNQISMWSDNELLGLEEVYDLIFYDDRDLTPEEILAEARRKNKPILL